MSGSCRTFGVRARPHAAFGICSAIESDATTHRTPKALSCENPEARALPGTAQGGATVITRLARGQGARQASKSDLWARWGRRTWPWCRAWSRRGCWCRRRRSCRCMRSCCCGCRRRCRCMRSRCCRSWRSCRRVSCRRCRGRRWAGTPLCAGQDFHRGQRCDAVAGITA